MTTNVSAAKAALRSGTSRNLASTSRLARCLTDEYVLGKKLGTGSYAVVKEGMNKSTRERFAVKIIDKKHAKETRLKSEVALMGQVDHPNCVKLWDVFSDPDRLSLVLDLLTGGTVLDRILEIESFSEVSAASVMVDVLNALHYLHNIGITHRDLKPENLLYVTSDPTSPEYNVIKIVDFGLAKLQNDKNHLQTVCGTPYFIAPEILEEKHATYGAEVDVWSLGVILYFMLCGFHPFDDAKYPVMFNNIKKGRYTFPSPFWDEISDGAKDYITKSLTVDPAKRPTALQCMDHHWIKSVGDAASSKLHASHRSFLLIQKLPIFQRIDAQCLLETSKRLKVTTCPPGDYVCRSGDQGDAMYFVNAGAVVVYVNGVEIDRKGIGGFFGEAALVFKQTRIADVKSVGARAYKDHGTTDPTELFELHRSDFNEVCKMYPELKSRLAMIAEANMHRVNKAKGSVMYKLKQGIMHVMGRRESSSSAEASPERSGGRRSLTSSAKDLLTGTSSPSPPKSGLSPARRKSESKVKMGYFWSRRASAGDVQVSGKGSAAFAVS
uniref:cGMP-dependent protein kinase n=2 Tax=Hemiselmis andersenii TaxID=464988 RepID=A0A6U4N5F2_HEMAN|mmetsp:Transcript_22421/g.51436  ORF Transcript_22421/g.51436 Transcript_22421/m.51436 type:complete len:552 (+) Transcript_22421:84-1739(+)